MLEFLNDMQTRYGVMCRENMTAIWLKELMAADAGYLLMIIRRQKVANA
jgi:hypothetical protein